ncbi:MAG: Rne/Rng family ribonuclease [Bacteroidetes bacterium]|nr:Rne/Rng family ribonuclease [Bacteroidota bacterium]
MVHFRKEIIINARNENEVRIAITEQGRLVELFVENPETVRHVGEIWMGKVAKVIPGMNAAFIDLGLTQDAFLHFSDVGNSYDGSMSLLSSEGADMRDDDDESEDDEYDDDEEGPLTPHVREARPAPKVSRAPRKPFTTLEVQNVDMTPGQNIMVQVTREAFANKGVRVTSRISLPGRFLVLVPFEPGIGISKKVASVRERRRLRRIIRALKPREMGVIIRTVAENKEESALREDIEKLLSQWREIEKKIKEKTPPMILYQESNITTTVLRDLFSNDITRIVVDDKKMYQEVLDYIQWSAPNLAGVVEPYKGNAPLFEQKGIEQEIEGLMSKKVPLPSGGYLFIEKTEAMVVIDVNSGRYAARREQELNSLKTNLEAAREAARQLRLRDIGGIIVIDFIDMLDDRNNKKVYDEMKKELRRDRAKSSVLPLTDFGLMQITRQRVRQAIGDTLSDQCPACGGTGLVVGASTVMHQIERWLDRYSTESDRAPLVLRVHPTVHEELNTGFISKLRKLAWKFKVRLKSRLDDEMRADEYKFSRASDNKDITNQYIGPRPDSPADTEESTPTSPATPKRRDRREGDRRGNGRGGDRRRDSGGRRPEGRSDRGEGRPERQEPRGERPERGSQEPRGDRGEPRGEGHGDGARRRNPRRRGSGGGGNRGEGGQGQPQQGGENRNRPPQQRREDRGPRLEPGGPRPMDGGDQHMME